MGPAPATVRRTGFVSDLRTIALRSVRLTLRDPEAIVPALIVSVFFLVVNIGALQNLVEASFPPGFDFKAFQLPVAVVFSITGVSRAGSLVLDVQDGYLDRLLLTPVHRVTLLLGLMVADLFLVAMLTTSVGIVGTIIGVDFAGGPVGFVWFVLIGAAWGLAFTGFPYAIALRTGNPTAVNNAFLLFFPFAFLTSAYVPLVALTGWLRTVARYNPATYVLEGMRAAIADAWAPVAFMKAFTAIGLVAAASFTLAFLALRGRVSRG